MGDDEIGDAGEPRAASSSSITSGSPPGLALVATSTQIARRIAASRAPAGLPASRVEQQMMHRRIGQHHAEMREAGRDRQARARRRDPASARSARSADASNARSALGRLGDTMPSDAALATMTANGLASRALRRRSAATAASFARVAHQMKAADPLQRDDSAGAQQPRRSSSIAWLRRGPQCGQAIGSAWKRRFAGSRIVARTGRAHGETRHRRSAAGHRAAARDGVARAAMGAVDEGIEMKAARRIEQFVEAVLAGRGVGGDAGASPRRRCSPRSRSPSRRVGATARSRRVDPRQRRRLAPQRGDELADARALDLDQHAVGVVGDEAAERVAARQPIDERAEADALHRAAHAQAEALRCSICRRCAGRPQLIPTPRRVCTHRAWRAGRSRHRRRQAPRRVRAETSQRFDPRVDPACIFDGAGATSKSSMRQQIRPC